LQLLILPPALRHDVVTGIWCCPEAVKAPETIRQDMPKSNQEPKRSLPSVICFNFRLSASELFEEQLNQSNFTLNPIRAF
jgi:hypothetical protein